MKNLLKKIRKNSERGQAIILVAFSIVGMVAIVGLMVDGGILLIEYARLKRGIDSASIAAASQFRKGFIGADMERAGKEFLKFNQSDATVSIFTCDYPGTSWDETLCSPAGMPKRKLVRIIATRRVDFGFMRVVGMNGTTITASSVGEAASLDMILIIDTSGSMAYGTTTTAEGGTPGVDKGVPGGHAGDDPNVCNTSTTRRCLPMGQVKDVAKAFVDAQFFPYDRVALVTTTEQIPNGSRNAKLVLPFSDNDNSGTPNTEVQDYILGLKVHQPPDCPQAQGPCRIFAPEYDTSTDPPTAITVPYYQAGGCKPYQDDGDPTSCGASNIGGALYEAGKHFAYGRQDAFWVAIALFGGPANATSPSAETPTPLKPDGFCPGDTWDLAGGSGFCRDEDPMPANYDPATYVPDTFDWSTYNWKSATRHFVDRTNPANPIYPTEYDADDYARDGADYITSRAPGQGQGAVLFSICMGTQCRKTSNDNDPASGQRLGEYMAYHAGDYPYNLPTSIANHGLYFYAENPSVLTNVFAAIAKNIQTRISK